MAEIMNEERKKSSTHKMLKYIVDAVVIIMIVLLAILTAVFAVGMRNGEQPSLFNYKMFIVRSNSMSPEFKTGSLILVDAGETEFSRGDIITYIKDDGNLSTTHRIVEVYEGETTRYITRGDANEIDDPLPVFEDEIIGRVVLSIPLIGYVLGFIQKRWAFVALWLVPSVVIVLFIIREIMKELERGKLSL
ncbi:signal peptidase, endoplasmic reticulum-type [Dethiosulfatibacter aminovorans DSM 17477]|uniref:Signal peptidase I n=1 Tax=Dethiosulfatibacter aminovorans DSM 17477 TaxID=1121476 RepID=A0A1M6B094_9FIRM|nr:signal peptidase I [Dethiosulfatibacter aminovorans]SHI42140.1 signal peptidase, endoplasmic reticulum-type [Dethiosulfatibacter aminovorans DSM 17477]